MQRLITGLLLHSCAVFSKSTTLALGDSSKDGAFISSIYDVSESSAGWSIKATTKQGFNLKLSLDNTWGFRSGHKSTIEIIIDGDTTLHPASVDQSNPDLDALFAVSVSDQQYIAFQISLDNDEPNFASPGCSHSEPIPVWEDNVNSIVDVPTDNDRRDRLFQRDRIQSMHALGITQYIDRIIMKPTRDRTVYPHRWPLQFTLLNDPMKDILNVSFVAGSWNGFAQYCVFNAFDLTNAGLDLFMAVDDIGEEINYQSFTIHASYEETSSPTKHPSASPTWQPTQPSVSPTNDPSRTPSEFPSFNPTVHPSHDPSVSPTLDPSFSPFAVPQSTYHPVESNSSDENQEMNGSVTAVVIISVMIVVICIAITFILIKLFKGAKKAKEIPVILSSEVAVSVSPATNNKAIEMGSSSDVCEAKEREESFEVIGDHEAGTQGCDDGEGELERGANQLPEGKSIPNELAVEERVFATNAMNQKEDSFEIIGDDETPMDNTYGSAVNRTQF